MDDLVDGGIVVVDKALVSYILVLAIHVVLCSFRSPNHILGNVQVDVLYLQSNLSSLLIEIFGSTDSQSSMGCLDCHGLLLKLEWLVC